MLGSPSILARWNSGDADVNDLLDFGSIHGNGSVECENTIEHAIFIEGFESVGQRLDITLCNAGCTYLTYKIAVSVVISRTFRNTVVIVEKGSYAFGTVRGD